MDYQKIFDSTNKILHQEKQRHLEAISQTVKERWDFYKYTSGISLIIIGGLLTFLNIDVSHYLVVNISLYLTGVICFVAIIVVNLILMVLTLDKENCSLNKSLNDWDSYSQETKAYIKECWINNKEIDSSKLLFKGERIRQPWHVSFKLLYFIVVLFILGFMAIIFSLNFNKDTMQSQTKNNLTDLTEYIQNTPSTENSESTVDTASTQQTVVDNNGETITLGEDNSPNTK